jgi:hypothetical protein
MSKKLRLPSQRIHGQLLSILKNIRISEEGYDLVEMYAKDIPNTEYNLYSTNNYEAYLFYMYLMEKYQTKCIGIHIDIDMMDGATNNKNFPKFASKIKDCISSSNAPVLIIPVLLENVNKTETHANMLVYRRHNNTIEHFESNVPHVSTTLNEYLEKLAQNVGAGFVNANHVCPYGPQLIEHSYVRDPEKEQRGYCQMWSALYAELCLRNPKMTVDK